MEDLSHKIIVRVVLSLAVILLFVSTPFPQDGSSTRRDADIISLREYVDLRFEVTQRAIDKAEGTMNSRLEGMNEFRSTLKDQAGTFVTRQELWASILAMAGIIMGFLNFQLNKAKKNGERIAAEARK